MPDGSNPGRVAHYTDRQVTRVRETVREPNRSDILQTIRKGKRGNIASPKPNQRTKPSWSKATVRNNARDLRILSGQLQGLDEHGLNEAEHAIFTELTENYDEAVADEDEAERIAADIWERFDEEIDRFDGWETHSETRKQIRRLIIRRLAKEHGKVALAKDDQFLEQTIEYLVENAE